MISHKYLCGLSASAYELHNFKKGDVEVAYIDNELAHIFAIRGTEMSKFMDGSGWKDLLRDISLWPKNKDGVDGHAGFIHGWHEIEDEVKAYVMARDPSRPVVLTGHSMGGAIALVGAHSLADSDLDVIECVTFGAPRVFDVRWMTPDHKEWLESITTQYQIPRDIVPGMMKWTEYKHIDNTFIGEDAEEGHRAPWYKRRFKHHGIEKYYKEI